MVVANWMRSGWGYRVISQEHLLRTIDRIGTYKAGRRFIWRGLPDATYDLQSSLGVALEQQGIAADEAAVRSRELRILEAARSWPLGAELGDVANDFHMLTMLRHHGAPARLLDVTSSPTTALWFACQKPRDATADAPGALFAFDVTDMPEYATANLSPTWGSLEDPLGWCLTAALLESAQRNRPFLLRPSIPDARMRMQEGAFLAGAVPLVPSIPGLLAFGLAHGGAPGRQTLADLFDPKVRPRGRPRQLPFVVVVIPTRVKRQVERHLRATYNRSRSVLFPDVGGFVDALREDEV
jgi:hypothetical protein